MCSPIIDYKLGNIYTINGKKGEFAILYRAKIWKRKIHWILFREYGKRMAYVQRGWGRKKAGSGGRQSVWFKLTGKSWITVWPNRETTRRLVIRLPVPYLPVRRIFPDSEMRKSDFLSLLRKGKQDRKWADYRTRAQSRQRQVECTRKNLSWNSFLRAITPAGLSFTTAKLLQTRKALGVEYYLLILERAVLCERSSRKKLHRDWSYHFFHYIIKNINYI